MQVNIAVRAGAVDKQRNDAVVIPVIEGRELSPSGLELKAKPETGEVLRSFFRRFDQMGRFGEIVPLYAVPGTFADRVVFVGAGDVRKLTLNKLRELAARTAQWLDRGGARDVAFYFAELEVRGTTIEERVRAIAEGVWLGLYRFDRYKSEKDTPRRPLRTVEIMVPSRRFIAPGEAEVRLARAACSGVYFARDLANEPPNTCTPAWLAEQAEKLAEEFSSIRVRVLGPKEIAEAGMRGLLAVARGAANEPRVIVLEYEGAGKGAPTTALVGKGLTFDAGGICLKPAKGMDEMKFDMSGAAAVLGAFRAVAEAELPVNLLGVIGATENLPGGRAYKPGEVIRMRNGTTVEVLNTDAEGRIVLGDVLDFAAEQNPAEIIDLATLTGACVVALGDQAAGLMGNDAGLVRRLRQAGEQSGDRAWPLPMYDEYQEKIKSEIADIKNIGDGGAGPITAACFLSRFVGHRPWAHLDIAGVAWTQKSTPLNPKGATGFGVRLLVQYLRARAAK